MDLLSDLSEPQRQAVSHVDGPLLVLSGAGSGKTRVITRRVAYLIQQGIAPGNVLAVTFTNKAAGEMRDRVSALGAATGATIATFHALCARLLREFAAEALLSRGFSIYDRADQIKMVKEAMSRLELPADSFPPAKVHAAISNAKNSLKGCDDFAGQTGSFYQRKVADVYRKYQTLLKANNALDFDDLLMRTVLLLRDRPDIREFLGRRYLYILIDEYQDTNHAQYLLAHGIAMDHENICATGDPDQSIYAWRGADISNIMEFEQDYPNAKVVRLEENYRSTAPILSAASRLIQRNTQRKDKALWTKRAGGADVRVVVFQDEHAEARELAKRIAACRVAGRACSDVAVFYRVNSLSRLLEKALFEAGIPYAVARGVEFYNRKEIKDVLAYLRVLVNPSDDLSCERIINTPPRGIGPTTVNRLLEWAASRSLGLVDACRQADQAGLGAGAAAKARAFGDLIASMAGGLSGTVREEIEQVNKRSGMEAALSSSDEDDRQALANVHELLNAAAEFDQNIGGTLAEFVQQVSLVSDVDHVQGGGGTVTLMTLHAAKGLEFPVVFIAGCEQGLLPFVRNEESRSGWSTTGQSIEDLEEERRLAFVGMTRAKEELTLMSARSRMVRGQTVAQSASQFLGELAGEHVTVEDSTGPLAKPFFGDKQPRGGYYAEVDDRLAIEALADAAEASGAREQSASDSSEGRQAAPDEDVPLPAGYEYLKIGSHVRHRQFGLGQVVSLSGSWPQTRAKVSFSQFGIKTLVLAQAHLEVLQ